MQAPILVFDHIQKTAGTIQPGPAGAKKLAEIENRQREQISTASGRPRD